MTFERAVAYRKLGMVDSPLRGDSYVRCIRLLGRHHSGGDAMPRWMLKCPKCSHDFTYTKIELSVIEEAWRDPFRVLPKPTFATGGENHICPGCKIESVFQRQQLFYREDTSDFVF